MDVGGTGGDSDELAEPRDNLRGLVVSRRGDDRSERWRRLASMVNLTLLVECRVMRKREKVATASKTRNEKWSGMNGV